MMMMMWISSRLSMFFDFNHDNSQQIFRYTLVWFFWQYPTLYCLTHPINFIHFYLFSYIKTSTFHNNYFYDVFQFLKNVGQLPPHGGASFPGSRCSGILLMCMCLYVRLWCRVYVKLCYFYIFIYILFFFCVI